METVITIIIAITVFAFQAYANFQKEQEKARQRKVSQPPLPEDNAQRPNARDREPRRQEASVLPQFENYSGVLDSAAPTHSRSTRRHQIIPKRLAVNEETDLHPLLDAQAFDLRDAVIKSAILERPYQ